MLWRKSLHSPSPPGLTSSIPEMNHHLLTMDSNASDHLADKNAGISATPESVQTTSTLDQDCNKTQTVDIPKQAEPPATVEDDANNSMGSEHNRAEHKALACKKAQRCLPHFLVLLTCVSYLLFQFLGVDLGLRLISGYTEPRLNRAEVQLKAALSDLVSESIVHHKLDTVLSSALQPQYQENYEHCLARGLLKADEIFLGIDFTPYPDARNQTMDWVMDNCDRLHYTPQKFIPHASKLFAMVATVRKSAEEVFALFKYRALLLRSKIRGVGSLLDADQNLVLPNQSATTHSEALTNMPLGFSLDWKGRSRCRLIYSGASLSSADEKKSPEAADRASKEMHKWTYPFAKLLHISSCIIKLLGTLQIMLLGNILGTMLFCYRAKSRTTSPAEAPEPARLQTALHTLIASLSRDEKLALGLIVNTFAYTLLHHQVTSISSEFDRLLLPVGLGFSAFHLPQAITFFDPVPWKAINAPEDVYSFCRAVRGLHLIAQDASAADSSLDEKEVKECCPLRRNLRTQSNSKPASKIGARFISPLTSISEDLQQERKSLHAELGQAVQEDGEDLPGYATVTDEEYDSDVQHASYVDLTGGATPTVSEGEEEGEWAVVED